MGGSSPASFQGPRGDAMRVTGAMPDEPDRIFCQEVEKEVPSGVTAPMPVITIRSIVNQFITEGLQMKISQAARSYFQTSDDCAIVNGMPSLLKEQRIALGKEIHEFAEKTRVRQTYLRAIEEGCFEKLPVPVYSRGYIRDYARALGVDPSSVLAAYEKFLRGPEPSPEEPSSETSPCDVPDSAQITAVSAQPVTNADSQKHAVTLTVEREIQLEEHTSGGRSLKLSLFFFALLVAVGGIVLYQMYGNNVNRAAQQLVPDVVVKEPLAVKPADVSQKPVDVPAAPVPPSSVSAPPPAKSEVASQMKPNEPQRPVVAMPPAPQTAGKKHLLALSAVDKVWVQLILDRTDKKEMLLNPGDSFRFEASDSFRLWIGNAGGLKVSLDGKEIAHGGKSGQALRLVLPDTATGQAPKPQKSDVTPKPSLPKPAAVQ